MVGNDPKSLHGFAREILDDFIPGKVDQMVKEGRQERTGNSL